jgi:hypothetical protein
MEQFFVTALAALTLMFFVYGYLVAKAFYYRKHQEKYVMRRMFPYELNYPDSFSNNKFGNIFFILSWLGTIALYLFNFFFRQQVGLVIGIASFSMAIILVALAIVLLLVPLNYLRVHMIASSLFLVLSIALPAFNCLSAYQAFERAIGNLDVFLSIFALVVAAIQVLVMLVCVLNPRATYQIYLQKEVTPEGKEILKRPNTIPLALNEWIGYIVLVLSSIPIVIMFFI